LKCPIVGDVKYGSKHKTTNRSLYLLSRSIEFIHPVSKEKTVVKGNKPSYGLWKEYLV
jgi:23S rRNA pseudouridine1911/1915/1917 synthase